MMLVIGECVLDVVETPDGATVAHPGGSPANVAVGLARLGQDAVLLTELGADEGGGAIRDHLDGAGVTTVTAASSTRTPSAKATIGADGAATYDFDIAWTLGACDRGLLARAGHVHTGSIASHILPGADAVEAALAAARAHATVSYDPNVRASLVGDHGEVLARTERLIALADVVKASDEDIAWLYPDAEIPDVLRAWTATGPTVAMATLGAEGALACVHGEVIAIPPVPVEVVDTVGAGDSQMAALLDGLAREGLLGRDRRAALTVVTSDVVTRVARRAAQAAAITVSRAGANPPALGELEAALGS